MEGGPGGRRASTPWPAPGCIRGGGREQAQPLAGARSPQNHQVCGPLSACPFLSRDPGSRTFLSTLGAGPGLRRLCLGTWALLAQGVTPQHPALPPHPMGLAPGLLSRPRGQLGGPTAPPAGHTHPLSPPAAALRVLIPAAWPHCPSTLSTRGWRGGCRASRGHAPGGATAPAEAPMFKLPEPTPLHLGP